MQYLRTYTSFFSHPRWGMNLLFGGLTFLIPIVGPIVWLGYQVDCLHARLNRTPMPPGEPFPAFDFQFFANYLKRGIWPFLALLIVMFPGMLLMACAFLPLLLIPIFDLQGAWLLLPILLTVLAYFLAILAWGLLAMPLALRAALTQALAPAFNFAWFRNFLGKVWPQLLLGHLFIALTAFPLTIVGYALCFVGMYPAMALLIFAQWQLLAQLYDQHLSRGGTPIPLAPTPSPHPTPNALPNSTPHFRPVPTPPQNEKPNG